MIAATRRAGAVLLLSVAACSSSTPETPPPEKLSSLGLFADIVKQDPADGVVPYDVNAVLYADEALKLRFIRVPKGQAATYHDSDPWDYPDGTLFIKTFYFDVDDRDPKLGRRLLETRIVEKEAGSWTARTYVWDDAQKEATLLRTGTTLAVKWTDETGAMRTLDYSVPVENNCGSCHERHHVIGPLGPRTRQLNRDHDYGKGAENQIDHLKSLGMVTGTIPAAKDRETLSDPYGADPIDKRARSYLEANCSHCHRDGGNAGASGLDLEITTMTPVDLGICREPSAAGPGSGNNVYDIVPGDHAKSIMPFRMESTEPEIKMPQLPTVTSDAKGTELIKSWIDAMPPMSCTQ